MSLPSLPLEGNMAEVKKREKIPEEMNLPTVPQQVAEELKIRVGEKSYPLPNLTLKQYRKLMKKMDTQDENVSEDEALDFMRDFYFDILKVVDPNIKKVDLDEMPIHQFGAEFLVKLKLTLFQIPLGS